MIKTIASVFVFILMLGGLFGGPPALLAEEKVLARVGDQVVTEDEVMELVAGKLLQLDRQRHDTIAVAVNGRVQDILTEKEAARRGISIEELLDKEVTAKTAEVPAAQVDAFYQARGIRQPKESVEPQIRRFIAYQNFVAALEAKADVEILTEPFRVPVEADGPAKGKDDAPVTIVEFGDFECPPCGKAYPLLKKLREDYADDIRVVFRQYPLRSLHPNAQKAGEAALCAKDQGKFWEMHDKMFENQRSLSVDGLKTLAADIGELDTEAFGQCLDDGRHAGLVEEDYQEGIKFGVSSTPTFFVNGRALAGVPSYETFSQLVEEELARRKGSEETEESSGP